MTTINVKSKSIRVYNTVDSIRYRMDIDQSVDAIVIKDDEYVDAQVKYLDFFPSVLVAQVINHVAGVDLMYNKKKEQGLRNGRNNDFGAAELQVILRDASIEIERTRFEAGDDYTTADGETLTHEHAGYNTSIVDIKVSDRVKAKLDAMFDSMFEL